MLITLLFTLVLSTLQWCYHGKFTHTHEVLDVNYSPDSSKIVVGCTDNNHYIYNSTSYAVLNPYTATTPASSVQFSPDGNYIAFGLRNGTVTIINASSYAFITSISLVYFSVVDQLQFNHNSTRLLACGADSYSIISVPSWVYITGFYPSERIMSCRFNTIVEGLAAGTKNGKTRLFSTSYSWVWTHQRDMNAEIWALDYSPNASHLVVGSAMNNRKAVVIATAGNTSETNITAGNGVSIFAVDWSPDGSVFAFGGENGRVYINNGTPGSFDTNLHAFTEPANHIYAMDFSKDGRWLAVGCKSKDVLIYDRDCGGASGGTNTTANATPAGPQYSFQNCPTEYYRNSTDSCRLCALDLLGCRKCTNSTSCLACSDQFYLNPSTYLCQPCIAALPGCTSCANSTVCELCLVEYYLQGGDCLPCITSHSGCLSCVNASYCLECVAVTHFMNGTVCVGCWAVDPHCMTCNSTHCFSCRESFFISLGACQPCAQQCLSCSTTSITCQSCQMGFYLSGSTCVSCTYPCANCTATDCFSCHLGYYYQAGFMFINSRCVQCMDNCTSCTSAASCLSCNTGYYLAGSSCLVCVRPCISCLDASTCLSCDSAHYLSGGACLSCSSVDPHCLSCNSSECWECGPGYGLNLTTDRCDSCSSLFEGCQLCTQSVCVLCSSSHYMDSTGCLPCIYSCLTCSNSTSCLSCPSGLYLDNSTQTCLPCLSCPSCLSSTECLSCELGEYLSLGSCISCTSIDPNCLYCDGGGCTVCSIPYYYAAGGCLLCAAGCLSCTNHTLCLQCQPGYYLDTSTDVCQQCDGGCSSCQTLLNCSDCLPGYYRSNYSCLPCSSLIQGCQLCNQTACLSCYEVMGYYLNGSNCSACSIPHCQECTNSTCLLCLPSFALSPHSSSCLPCSSAIPHCQFCTNSSLCQFCIQGYYPDPSGCMACPQGCFLCGSGSICSKCVDGYYLNSSNLCEECGWALSGCRECSSGSVCSRCLFGFYLGNSTCLPCLTSIQGCLSCSNSTACESCQTGYYLDPLHPDQCLPCALTLAGCAFCFTPSQCQLCSSGYYLSNSSSCLLCADPYCMTCNSTDCYACLSGHHLLNGSCTACRSTFAGCLFCNQTDCLSCISGLYLASSGWCEPCPDPNCQLCNSTLPGQCLHCNSDYYHDGGSGECLSCNGSMDGCGDCSSQTVCLSCVQGYYLMSGGVGCDLCSASIQGCVDCSISGLSVVCLDCINGYILTNGSCLLCTSLMNGCAHCQLSSTCLTCLQGYYLNTTSQLCQRCSTISGCLLCRSSLQCNLCSKQYYLTNGTCLSCSSSLPGCALCQSSSVCLSCVGTHILSGGLCSEIVSVVQQQDGYGQQLYLVSKYVSATVLSHTLWKRRGTFDFTDADLTAQTTLSYLSERGVVIDLTITSYEWGNNNDCIIFYTNNPFDFEIDGNGYSSMPLLKARRRLYDGEKQQQKGRLLQTSNLQLNVDFQISMLEPTVSLILASTLTPGGDMSLSYNINSPQFISSLIGLRQHYFHYFGWLITLYLLIFYFIKAVVLLPDAFDKGELISHILLMKTAVFAVFPSYSELIDYCRGFMLADLPWLNQFFSLYLSEPRDSTPAPYLVFYTSLSMASTYLLPLALLLFFSIVLAVIYLSCKSSRSVISNISLFLYNFFLSGLSLAAVACIQGAFLNIINEFTVKSSFYLLGIVIWILLVLEAVWSCSKNIKNMYKIRILAKTVLLSLLHYNPLYLCSLVLCTEIFFICLQLSTAKLSHPKLWVLSNIILDLALGMLIMLSYSLLSVYVASGLVVVALALEGAVLLREFRQNKVVNELKIPRNGLQINDVRGLEVRRGAGLKMPVITENDMVFQEEAEGYDKNKKVGIDDSQAHFFTLDNYV